MEPKGNTKHQVQIMTGELKGSEAHEDKKLKNSKIKGRRSTSVIVIFLNAHLKSMSQIICWRLLR